jgi:hypothetical protein
MRWARPVWIVLALVGIAIFLADTAASWPVLHTICRTACHSGQPDGATARTLHAHSISLSLFAGISVARDVLVVSIWVSMSALIIWHRPRDRGPLVAAFFLLLFPMNGENAVAVPALLHSIVPLTNALSGAALALFGFLFPNGRFSPRWMRWIALGAVVEGALGLAPRLLPGEEGWFAYLDTFAWVGVVFAILASQAYRYRVASSTEQQQQTKWALFGIGVSLGGILLLNAGYGVIPGALQPGSLYDLSAYWLFPLFTTSIPISIGIAMLRGRLWDVDRVINRALVYGSLTMTLAALYIGGVIALEGVARAVTGESSDLAIAAVTLAVAAIFNPWRRRLQTFIDRRFYRRKYDAGRILAAFTTALRDEVDLDELSADLAAVVQETVQPAHLSLWIRPGTAR